MKKQFGALLVVAAIAFAGWWLVVPYADHSSQTNRENGWLAAESNSPSGYPGVLATSIARSRDARTKDLKQRLMVTLFASGIALASGVILLRARP